MRRFCTVDQFARLAADGQKPSAAVATVSAFEPEVGESSRVVRYTFSTPAVGRDGHTVAADAWQLRNFLRNPVFLWAHDDQQPPIGRVVQIGDVNGLLRGDVEYAERDLNPFADMIYRMVKARYVNAVSTSWQPLDWRLSRDPERPGGVDFVEVDLLEISQVPIPALPSALAEARAHGIDTSPLREWAERVLDGGGSVVTPREELESLRRAATMNKPRSERTTTRSERLARALRIKRQGTTKTLSELGEHTQKVARALERALHHHGELGEHHARCAEGLASATGSAASVVRACAAALGSEHRATKAARELVGHIDDAASAHEDARDSATGIGNALELIGKELDESVESSAESSSTVPELRSSQPAPGSDAEARAQRAALEKYYRARGIGIP